MAVSSALSPPPTTSTFLPAEFLRIVQPVVNLSQLLARTAQFAEIPAAPDRHDHPPRRA